MMKIGNMADRCCSQKQRRRLFGVDIGTKVFSLRLRGEESIKLFQVCVARWRVVSFSWMKASEQLFRIFLWSNVLWMCGCNDYAITKYGIGAMNETFRWYEWGDGERGGRRISTFPSVYVIELLGVHSRGTVVCYVTSKVTLREGGHKICSIFRNWVDGGWAGLPVCEWIFFKRI